MAGARRKEVPGRPKRGGRGAGPAAGSSTAPRKGGCAEAPSGPADTPPDTPKPREPSSSWKGHGRAPDSRTAAWYGPEPAA